MNNQDYQATLDSPLGKLGVRTNQTALLHIDFISPDFELVKPATYIAKETVVQLQCFFADPLYQFDLALAPNGTEFQQRVWNMMLNIPVGKTLSYGEVAKYLNSSAQAVGNACRVNPIPIIVPCHRIVAHDGIGGYAGETQGKTIDRKKWLLAHEAKSAIKVKPAEETQAHALFA